MFVARSQQKRALGLAWWAPCHGFDPCRGWTCPMFDMLLAARDSRGYSPFQRMSSCLLQEMHKKSHGVHYQRRSDLEATLSGFWRGKKLAMHWEHLWVRLNISRCRLRAYLESNCLLSQLGHRFYDRLRLVSRHTVLVTSWDRWRTKPGQVYGVQI